ncbi:MAG: hypothetical protein M1376_09780 [Planctomycetes bacterium]|nr:hypothetical protein [Planctomycetota bacterium]
MDAAAKTDKITEWLNQQVDPAFEPLIKEIGKCGTPVQWERQDFARTLRVQFGAREITYTVSLEPDSDPATGQLLFKTPESENCKSFSPAVESHPGTSGEMTGSDIVNDLIDQYGQWCKHLGAPVCERKDPER